MVYVIWDVHVWPVLHECGYIHTICGYVVLCVLFAGADGPVCRDTRECC